ncbi:MAG: tRNA threonylcarbamoyladenosine dehydratase [Planctomycetaceae bacterium]|nr:tRNA threonylcarbamoyladenosine dehydratase [Planctomycetaceae bacterium]
MIDRAARFGRIIRLLGQARVQRLHDSYAAVVGLGATGSYAVEGMTRAGIGRFTLIDFDVIEMSNVNRQLYALQSTLGRAKCEVAAERVRDINPECVVDTVKKFVGAADYPSLFTPPPDIIVDCIDSLNPKVELLEYACNASIPIISCMGAALRTDASMIKVATLDKIEGCTLAQMVRKRLRKRRVELNFPCVYSLESRQNLLETAIGEVDNYSPGPGRKRRVLGSLSTITGIFGLTAANVAIAMLSQMDAPQK